MIAGDIAPVIKCREFVQRLLRYRLFLLTAHVPIKRQQDRLGAVGTGSVLDGVSRKHGKAVREPTDVKLHVVAGIFGIVPVIEFALSVNGFCG